MLKEGKLPGIDLELDLDKKECFKLAKIAKMNYTVDSLCNGRSKPLKPFMKYVFSLGFKDTPDY